MDLDKFESYDSAEVLYKTFPGIDWGSEGLTDGDFVDILEGLSIDVNRLIEKCIDSRDLKYETLGGLVDWVLDAGTVIIDVSVWQGRTWPGDYYTPEETSYHVSVDGHAVDAHTVEMDNLASYVVKYVKDQLPEWVEG